MAEDNRHPTGQEALLPTALPDTAKGSSLPQFTLVIVFSLQIHKCLI